MASKKYDFKTPLLDGEDQPIKGDNKDLLMSDHLSNLFLQSKTTDLPLKFFGWALELKKIGAITLDDTDKKTIETFILNNPNLTNLEKGRFDEIINKKN